MRRDITQLEEKQKGVVVEILGGYGLNKKLDALGIRVGVEIIRLSSTSLRGTVIVKVGNTQVALGYGIAKKIIVNSK